MFTTTKRISAKVRKEVYERDNYACALCEDARVIHLHHVIPKGRGGKDHPTNLISLCPYCHAVVHGETMKIYDFPFDAETAEDAIVHYLLSVYSPENL